MTGERAPGPGGAVAARLWRRGGPDRVAGLDLARGLAVLGMFGAHLGTSDRLAADPVTWPAIVHGRPSILFATLAGVSIALLSGGGIPATGEALVRARTRILVRAAWIFAIGGLLELLDTRVAIILGVYAVLFVLATPFLRWPVSRLLALAAGIAVAGPPLDLLLGQVATEGGNADDPFADLVITGVYPALLWWAYVLAGLAVGRSDVRAGRVRVWLVGAGTGAAVLGYGGGWLTTRAVADGRPSAGPEEGFGAGVGEWDPAWFTGAAPHSGTTFEMVGSTGVAVAVIGLCLLLAGRLPVLTAPLAAVGALALSVYTGHVVALWLVRMLDPAAGGGPGTWLAFAGYAVLAATIWRIVLGQGPLERLLTWSSRRTAALPSGPADHGPSGDGRGGPP
ncbi:heparan-alpha-glucosaminide N-acetyltransferase domain-containing protein [Blastococcus capsensis]|uniref:heparan-alpha-glucosaminide N-acetyltransferase domain-containing protein n=1 Tax=Blastococcus capsensis TaxID=1564163 RepID=UPI002540A45F|nr:heparan-alpha-glucosaminide N-acetyltransferase domain-containing protein [Blastococcus capsensis]MDK3258429.1 heparan-alpha-glucosaminide N-acetyltransferase domain-containing protein [Blastococcus capsensis]